MRMLVVGAGGVGSAIVSTVASRGFADVVVADVDVARAQRAAHRSPGGRVSATRVDAASQADIERLARESEAEMIVNACDPRLNPPIFHGAYAAGCHYLDMAMTLSEPHPVRPYEEVGVMLGEAQMTASSIWEDRGQLALVSMGVEPGLSDVFARYAGEELFSSIVEIGVRDGSDLEIEGYRFAPTFSIWTVIEECLNPPLIWERGRGWYTTEPFSEPEVFVFPEGIGPLECVNVEHEEVLLIPRYVDCGRVTFKYGLGSRFIEILEMLRDLGLDGKDPVDVRGVQVAPRDVVAAVLPNPAELGEQMRGRTCAGTWVTGTGVDGARRAVYLYQLVDNEWSMREKGHQAVVWQTAVNAAVALELVATGEWRGAGVLPPEAFPHRPFLDLLNEHGAPWAMVEEHDD